MKICGKPFLVIFWERRGKRCEERKRTRKDATRAVESLVAGRGKERGEKARRGGTSRGMPLFHLDQFDLEDQGRIGRDGATGGAAFSVGELGRDIKDRFAAFFEELQAFRPTRNYLAEGELDRLVAFVGTVKLRSVDEGSRIVDFDGIASSGGFSGAFFDDFVLEPAGGRFHAFVFRVFREKLGAFDAVLRLGHKRRDCASGEDGKGKKEAFHCLGA